MTFESESLVCQQAFPIQAEPNACGVAQQPGCFLLPGELGESLVKRMLRRKEGLLAMKDRRIGAGPVVVPADLAGDEIDDHRFVQGWVWMLFKIRVGKKRDLWRGGVEFQEVEPRADFQTLPQLSHRDSEQGRQGWGFAWVDDIHRTGQSLAIGQGVDGLSILGGSHVG